MADQERDLSPEHDARVRRLLAQTHVDEPTPPDVVRRLDGVLEGLAGQDATGNGVRPEPAVDLATRRRRRRVTALLVAAAVVFVVGVGVDQVVGGPGSGSDSGAASTVTQSDADGADTQEAPDRTSDADALASRAEPVPEAPQERDKSANGLSRQSTSEVAPYAVALGGGGLTEAVEQVLGASRGAPVGDSGYVDLTNSDLGPRLSLLSDFACTPADWGRGRLVPVLYKGSPKVLALRVPEGKTQVVEVLQCGTGEVVRSLTLPTG